MNKKRMISTSIAGTLAAAILVGGGTFAYLKDETDPIDNNFKGNSVSVSLEETTGTEYSIVPGTEAAKDPMITLTSTVPSYLFLVVEDTTKTNEVDWKKNDAWRPVDGEENVFYQKIDRAVKGEKYQVIDGDKVTYLAEAETATDSHLKFTAYAIQQASFEDAAAAWAQAKPQK